MPIDYTNRGKRVRVRYPTRTIAKLLPAGWTGEVQYELRDPVLNKQLVEAVWDEDGSQTPIFLSEIEWL
jgi:hypothetical protein